MGKLLKIIVILITAGAMIAIDEYLLFPVIHKLPSPLDALGLVIASGLELAGLVAEAKAIL